MNLYKLTDENYKTFNNTKWEIGKTNSLPFCKNPPLCSYNVFHAYKNLNLGLLLNPIHANFKNFKILLCEGEIKVEEWGKIGTFKLTPIKEIEIPSWYQNEETRRKVQLQFAILYVEKSLPIFEKEFPEDARPRKAIDAAKNYLKNPTKKNAKVAKAAVKALYTEDCTVDDVAYNSDKFFLGKTYTLVYNAVALITCAVADARATVDIAYVVSAVVRAITRAFYTADIKIDLCELADQAVIKMQYLK